MAGFAEASAVERLAEGRWRGRIQPGWDIRGNTNGGYLLAIAARAMLAETGRSDPITLTAHYLGPGREGPVEVEVGVLKQGRRLGTARALLTAGGKPLLAALGSFGALGGADQALQRIDGAPPELPPPEACYHQHPVNGAPAMFGQVEMRLHPEDAGFALGSPGGQPRMRGWIRPLGDAAVDTLMLLHAVDAFPPAMFNARLPFAWVPTVELTLHIRARPARGWLRGDFRTRFVSGGYLEEDGEIWDASGQLVAQSRQLAMLPQAGT